MNIPTLKALYTESNGDVRFTLVGYPSTMEIAREFLPPHAIEAIKSIETQPWCSLFHEPLSGLDFDLAIVWMSNTDVVQNLQLSGIKCVFRADPFPTTGHAAAHLLKTLNLPGPRLPDLWKATTDRIILHPGSGSRRKCWSGFNSLVGKVGSVASAERGLSSSEVAFLLGPNEEDFETAHPTLAGLTLPEVAYSLRACRGYIGNDSGITHLAAYLGVPTVALFGPTDPEIWGPWGRRVRIISRPAIDAIPVQEVLQCAEWIRTNKPT